MMMMMIIIIIIITNHSSGAFSTLLLGMLCVLHYGVLYPLSNLVIITVDRQDYIRTGLLHEGDR